MSSGVSASPSSLESRALSPAAAAQLWGDGSGLGAGAGAGGRGVEVEVEVEVEVAEPGTLGMCAFASRSFSVDRGRPFGQ